MKNVIIVSKGNTAVAVGDNNQATITKSGVGAFLANLEVVKEILLAIPTEPSETVHVYVPDMIQGICSGSAIEYVKTGKTASGNELSAEEKNAFAEFYKLYAERILNVRFTQFKYIAKDNVELQNLKKKAWDSLNSASALTASVTTQTIDPDKAIREALDVQIVKALSEGNMEMYTMLKAERDKLTPAQVVSVPVAGTVSGSVVNVSFDEADKAFEEANADTKPATDENGTPIEFTNCENTTDIPW